MENQKIADVIGLPNGERRRDPDRHATTDSILVQADLAIADAERLLSFSEAERWLVQRGVHVRRGRVRDWVRSGRLRVVRDVSQPRTKPGRKPSQFVPLSALEHIAQCPLCSAR